MPPAVTGFSVHRRPIRFLAAEPKRRGGGKNGQHCRLVCGRNKTFGVFGGLLMVAAGRRNGCACCGRVNCGDCGLERRRGGDC